MDEERQWIIQRCTHKWRGGELEYEDWPTPEGRMTREEMVKVLERVAAQYPESDFRGCKVRETLV